MALLSRKSALILLLRLGVSVGLLIVLFVTVDIDFDSLWPDDAGAVVWLLAAFGCMVGSMVLATFRWQQVCRALELVVATRRLFWHIASGQFVSNFVPTTVGGDVLRVTRLGRDTGDRPTSFTTVILERLSGWMVLPAAILAGLVLDPKLRAEGGASGAALSAALITLAALALIILAAGNDLTGRLLHRRQESLRWLHSVHEGIDALRAHPAQIGRILGTGAAYQGLLVLGFWCAAHSIGIEGFGLRAAAAFVPAVLIVQVLPLGIGGLGVREGALVLFLSSLDVPNDEAVALGLTMYALTIIMSLIGLPAMVFAGGGISDTTPVTVGADPS